MIEYLVRRDSMCHTAALEASYDLATIGVCCIGLPKRCITVKSHKVQHATSCHECWPTTGFYLLPNCYLHTSQLNAMVVGDVNEFRVSTWVAKQTLCSISTDSFFGGHSKILLTSFVLFVESSSIDT